MPEGDPPPSWTDLNLLEFGTGRRSLAPHHKEDVGDSRNDSPSSRDVEPLGSVSDMRRALLFDYDGVIVDSEVAVANVFVEVLAEDGIQVTFDDFGHLLGTTGPEGDERWQRFIRQVMGPSVLLEEIEQRMAPRVRRAYEELTVLPGVRELMDAASAAGWALGLGTGNTGPIDSYLERLGLADVFEAVVRTHGSGLASKPAPDVFLALAECLDVLPEQCVVVEDSVPGCEAAIAAGMSVVVCPTIATAGCSFPESAISVSCLADVTLDALDALVTRTMPG